MISSITTVVETTVVVSSTTLAVSWITSCRCFWFLNHFSR
ncbi:hypothetical protein EVA_15848 [gut metagenome]|uniref:Uncharacterized protein n=1 Tax=gut metagenome TaxID=749906 RepID=J9FMB8_9ZZZZ